MKYVMRLEWRKLLKYKKKKMKKQKNPLELPQNKNKYNGCHLKVHVKKPSFPHRCPPVDVHRATSGSHRLFQEPENIKCTMQTQMLTLWRALGRVNDMKFKTMHWVGVVMQVQNQA